MIGHAATLNNQTKLMHDYRNREELIYSHFDYDPFQIKSFHVRHQSLMKNNYQREKLVDIIKLQQERFGSSDATDVSLNKLLQDESTVIIAGQQAGLLTGPAYTIHKIVSIIKLAKEQESYLNKPVIPVFWIASEDHDFSEINHIYKSTDDDLEKFSINDEDLMSDKRSISDRKLPEDINQWLNEILVSLQETENTHHLQELFFDAAKQSETYVDFFGIIINKMFEEEGLLLFDANAKEVREIESSYFNEIIQNQHEIATGVVNDLNELENKGYQVALDVSSNDAHLFYHDKEGNRLILEVNEEGNFQTKDLEFKFTKQELIEISENQPYLLSNNVVSRPIMQEFLFPVLAFVGGPGEISYWSTFKSAFSSLSLELPIVTPRLSFTLMSKSDELYLKRYGLSFEELINNGSYPFQLNWLKRQTAPPLEELLNQFKKSINQSHKPVQEAAEDISSDMSALASTNLKRIEQEVDFLEKRMNTELKRKNKEVIDRFEQLNVRYHPKDGLQERVWNILYWLNDYGLSLPSDLTKIPPKWEQDHQIIIL
ncbi:bacillithiol biosynthesis cysteine-adding enzyme BshC [Halalkalibacillus halophilus]|uniref:bacillithiol biosynthesis cysteine-adding enzyme BshC n=1 Tax=Halalkalibacillus halophilus TaxID=392827 RepID=UPI00042993A5|nr:bacillithiol biosynthesis cysteine-adding enzyme BshC [Halalkalibacillus halophilus]